MPHVNDPSIQPEETTSSPHRVTRQSQIPIIPTIPEMISDDQNPQCLTTPIPQLPPEDLSPQSKASEPIISKSPIVPAPRRSERHRKATQLYDPSVWDLK